MAQLGGERAWHIDYCKCMAVLTKQHLGMDKPSRLGRGRPSKGTTDGAALGKRPPRAMRAVVPASFLRVHSSSQLFLWL